jgi:hypothetical protein
MPSRRIIVIAHEVKQRANLQPAGSFRRSSTSRREPGLWVRSSSFPLHDRPSDLYVSDAFPME